MIYDFYFYNGVPLQIRNLSLSNLESLVPTTLNTTFIAFSKTFVQKGLNLSEAYVKKTRDDDGLDVTPINFRYPEKAATAINNWVRTTILHVYVFTPYTPVSIMSTHEVKQ